MTAPAKFDVHATVADKIAAQIAAGAGDFQMPWHRAAPLHRPNNVASKKKYRGINILSLWIAAERNGFASNTWGTYKQWQEAGCQVRKGEKSSIVVVYKEYERTPDPNNPGDDGRRMFARASNVFNAAQVDGFEAPAALPDLGPIERLALADSYVSNTGARISHGGQRAFYSPAADAITMPSEGLFFTSDRTEQYYSTLFHELTHWTGVKHRCNRDFQNKFGNPAYAFEELVAELGAAFLCADLGISNEPRKDHAQYIANWLHAIKDNPRAIFSAASKASQAVDFLDALQLPASSRAAA